MKVVVKKQYTLPEEKGAYLLDIHATEYYLAIENIRDIIRNSWKYDKYETVESLVRAIQDKLPHQYELGEA